MAIQPWSTASRIGTACRRTAYCPVPGDSSANFIALSVAAQRGDTIVMENPTYSPLRRVASFLGLDVVPIERSEADAFDVRVRELESRLRRSASAVVLTNLHNPSGKLLPHGTMEQIAAVAASAGATLIVDEVYLDGTAICASQAPWTAAGLGDHVLAVNSLTKVYGLSGLRISWILGGRDLIQ